MTDIIFHADKANIFYKAIVDNITIHTYHIDFISNTMPEYVLNGYINANILYKMLTERLFISMTRVEVMFSLIDERVRTFPEESANVSVNNIEVFYSGSDSGSLTSTNMEVMLTQLPDPVTKGRYEIIQQEILYLANPKMTLSSTNLEVLLVFPPRRRPIYHPS